MNDHGDEHRQLDILERLDVVWYGMGDMALGNSMACNCMAWIGERIAAVEARHD